MSNLSEKIQEIIKEPFVFVSYCHENETVYKRVQKLVLYLKK